MRKKLKKAYLGLASLDRTIARQLVRLAWLRAGDTDAAFLRLRAAHHKQRNQILDLRVDDSVISDPDGMASAAFEHFLRLLGTEDTRSCSIALDAIDPRIFDFAPLKLPFSEEEVWRAVCSLPKGKAAGPDGFTAEFLCAAWDVIKGDIMDAFAKLHSLNGRAFHKLNEAFITLLPKSPDAASLSDYRPISLIHLIAKLFAKVLSLRLAPHLKEIISTNQSAFIAGRSIHDNFMLV